MTGDKSIDSMRSMKKAKGFQKWTNDIFGSLSDYVSYFEFMHYFLQRLESPHVKDVCLLKGMEKVWRLYIGLKKRFCHKTNETV